MKPAISGEQFARLLEAYASESNLERVSHVRAAIAADVGLVQAIACFYNGSVVDGEPQTAIRAIILRARRAAGQPVVLPEPVSGVPSAFPVENVTKRAKRASEALVRAAEGVLADSALEGAERLERAEKRAADIIAHAERKAEDTKRALLVAARVDILDTRADEAQIAKLARKNVVSAEALVSVALLRARAVAERVVTPEEVAAMTPLERVRYLRACTLLVQTVNQAASAAFKLERLRVGDPGEIIEIRQEAVSNEDAAREITSAANLLAIAQNRGLVPRAAAEDPPPDPDGNGGEPSVH